MRAGTLRHVLMLQNYAETQDEIGQPVQAWTDFAAVRADVRFLSGLEVVKADASVATTKASIRIRYLPGVVPAMRAVYDGKNYNITAVLADPTGRRYLDLVSETGAVQN